MLYQRHNNNPELLQQDLVILEVSVNGDSKQSQAKCQNQGLYPYAAYSGKLKSWVNWIEYINLHTGFASLHIIVKYFVTAYRF